MTLLPDLSKQLLTIFLDFEFHILCFWSVCETSWAIGLDVGLKCKRLRHTVEKSIAICLHTLCSDALKSSYQSSYIFNLVKSNLGLITLYAHALCDLVKCLCPSYPHSKVTKHVPSEYKSIL